MLQNQFGFVRRDLLNLFKLAFRRQPQDDNGEQNSSSISKR
jgi:hypothetical protein